ncbi:hypothetical protein PIB30_080243 [Stylosanthes scabra]|uniref:Uncharacterized protein n=1 Tax=Stylosanthes scabra TaxID=79078 RepID=A0ABU6ZQ06_9FABA|nr:hypothetical protein [Stylosanthes scabra]
MEGTYSYDQGYTPWNPPPYQDHAPQYNVYQSNGFSDAYYGYEDPPPPYSPSQGNFEGIFQVLLQVRKEIREAQKRIEAQLAILTELVHECLKEVEEKNVDQELADEDKESKGMEILQPASSEATPPESPSKLHFEWQSQEKLVDSHSNGWTNQVWDPQKSYKNQHFWRVIACIGAFRNLLNMNWDPIENTKFKHWWGFKDEFKHKPP